MFIILFLHQTTTPPPFCLIHGRLFIILFLHQTTTFSLLSSTWWGCLSSCSYIKPQLAAGVTLASAVVYHLVPTSNHNLSASINFAVKVVYHLVPTSNHNRSLSVFFLCLLFIILFLHQTTTKMVWRGICRGCLSSCSYIKPQPSTMERDDDVSCLSSCSYIKPQLSLLV